MSLCPVCERFHADKSVFEYEGIVSCPQCRIYVDIKKELKLIKEILERMEEQNGKEDT